MREQKNIIHKSATSRMSVVNVMPPITPIVSWSDELCIVYICMPIGK